MTTSQQRLALLALVSVLAAPVRAEHHEDDGHDEPAAPVIQVVSTNVQGKNVFIPATIVVESGKPHVLSIYNTTDTPHGFAIPDLGVEVVLPVQQEFELALPALEGGTIHRIQCHLHPPHRNATLVVLGK